MQSPSERPEARPRRGFAETQLGAAYERRGRRMPARESRDAEVPSSINAGTDPRPAKTPPARARNDLFRTAFDQAFQFAGLLSIDGTVREVNRSALRFGGLRRDQVVGRYLWDTPWLSDSPEVQARLPSLVRQAAAGQLAQIEVTLPGGDGQMATIDFSLKAVADETGRITWLLAEGWDITAVKEAEAAPHQPERAAAWRVSELGAVCELMADGVIVFDREGQIEYANAAMHALVGLHGVADYLNWTIADRVTHFHPRNAHGEPMPVEQLPASRVLRGETLRGADTVELMVRTLDGREIEVSASGAPLRDSAGAISGAVCVVREVTSHRRLERHARAEVETRLRLLQATVDELPSGVYLVQSRDARLVLANRAAVDVWGAPWPVGQPMSEFLEQSDTRIFGTDGHLLSGDELATVRAVRTGAHVGHYQEIIRRHDGTTLPILLNAIALDPRRVNSMLMGEPSDGAAPEPVVLVALQDVTALKEAERLKDEFIAIAAHELRNPATSIKGYAALLNMEAEQDWDAAHHETWFASLRTIEQAATQLVELVNDLVDVTRLQAGRLALDIGSWDLVPIVRRVVAHLQVTTERHTLVVEAPDDPVTARVDPQRIEQVIGNLVGNAIKYSPQGGNVEVSVRAERPPGLAVIALRDQGIGIPMSQQARVFRRFERAENARQHGIEGSGLGLYLSHELVTRQGGRIWFESTEGKGSAFYVALPLEADGTSGETRRTARHMRRPPAAQV